MNTKFDRILTLINVSAAVITAAAALAIPIVLYVDAKSTRTLDVMNDLDSKASEIVAEKIRLDDLNKVAGTQRFEPNYIDHKDHYAVQTQVYRLLNLYDYVCLGGKTNLFSLELIQQMRGDALRQTWADYGAYIKAHREKSDQSKRAWENCDSVAAEPMAG
ncbi:hypothetical protein NKI38_30330 [Mesorhizobium sp. M0621]|uniref:DUF4760 domain-containing protein n=1 Tax=Mesorhizobium sp. M0621 TaxID=2956974 RepID=UPI0033357945